MNKVNNNHLVNKHLVNNCCMLVLVQQMDILNNMAKIDVRHYSLLMKNTKELIESGSYSLKSNNLSVYYHSGVKIKINFDNDDDDLSLEKTLSMQNVLIFTGHIFNNNYNC